MHGDIQIRDKAMIRRASRRISATVYAMSISAHDERQTFKGRRILVGVTGGIAAYKSAELVRMLQKAGADVHVCMTEAATKFITPLTLETLSGNPVRQNIWDLRGDSSIAHTEWGRDMDAVIVAPATADFLGRLANGLADQLLLNVLLASRMPVLLCPSMNDLMWANPLVQQNVERLAELDRFRVLSPGVGWLACGVVGAGRMPDPADIVDAVARQLRDNDLEGQRVLVTAGPTREHFDPVRFLSNPSTGRMGFALAYAAWERGAEVTLIAGPTSVPAPTHVETRHIGTTEELLRAVSEELPRCNLLLMAAAPVDFRPEVSHEHKQKKGSGMSAVALQPNPDVLKAVAELEHSAFVVGFAAETQEFERNAVQKVRRKQMDLIFVNRVGAQAASTGFSSTTNAGAIIDSDGRLIRQVELGPKVAVAHTLLDEAIRRMNR